MSKSKVDTKSIEQGTIEEQAKAGKTEVLYNKEGLCLEVNHLTKKRAGKRILDDLNLVLPRGHVMGLLGPNGAGKTTLLKILAGLIHPTGGEAYVNGAPFGTETKGKVSYLPDQTILEGTDSISSLRKDYIRFFDDFDKEKFDDLVDRLQIPMKTKVKSLSKGYKDRLAVSLALSRKADLYLLDEPLGGVDPLVRDQILDIIIDSIGDEATMIISTHQVRDLERIFDYVCFLNEGRIVEFALAEAIRRDRGMTIDDTYKAIFARS